MPDLTYLNTHANCQTDIDVAHNITAGFVLNLNNSTEGVLTLNLKQDSAFFATVTGTHKLIASNEDIRTATGNVAVCEYGVERYVFWAFPSSSIVEFPESYKFDDILLLYSNGGVSGDIYS